MGTTQEMVRTIVAEAIAEANAQGVEVTAAQRDELAALARNALNEGHTMTELREQRHLWSEVGRG